MFATMGVSAGSEAFLTRLYEKMVRREADPPASVLLMGWNNLPARSEKSLYDLAEFCRRSKPLEAHVLKTPTDKLLQGLMENKSPGGVETAVWAELHARFTLHLQEYGYMIFELDFAKPLPSDFPLPMLEAVKMYLRGEGVNPYQRQEANTQKRLEVAERSTSRLRGLRRWLFVKVMKWAQSLSEIREDALADIGLGYPLLRRMLLRLGGLMVQAGAIDEAGDIYWLEKTELEKCVSALESKLDLPVLQESVEQRKSFHKQVKGVIPPPMLPLRKRYLGFNTTIWLAESEGNQAGDTLRGVAASGGKVSALARVLHGPDDFDRMRPGEVLVAGTTTPAWTPLFAMASAVVTDIGGPLSHGSIVAREYHIPAVMGTGVATRRIRDGQRITVDGDAGTVKLEQS